jgi:YVTN family beta-propeller protein
MTQPRTVQPANPTASRDSDGIEWLRRLGWRQFEELIGAAYQRHGYHVIDTGKGADGGVDLILVRGGERIFVQCKNWTAWRVGVRQVRELKGVVATEGATGGIVVTSGRFTKEAAVFARQAGVALLDGPQVVQLVGPVAMGQPHPHPQPSAEHQVPPRSPQLIPSSPQTTQRPVGAIRRGPRTSLFTRFLLALAVSVGAALMVMLVTSLFGAALVANLGRSSPALQAGTAPTRGTAGSTGTPGVGEQPMDIAIDTKAKRLYTANFVSGNVSVLDEDSLQVVDTIDVPGQPVAIAVDPAHHRVFVADGAANRVYAVDTTTGKKTATMKTRAKAADLAYDPKRGRLFVGSAESNHFWVFSTAKNRLLRSIPTYGPTTSLAIDTHAGRLYAAYSANVFTYKLSNLVRDNMPHVGMFADGIAIDTKRQRLYVIISGHAIQEQNLLTGKTQILDLDGDAKALCIDPSTRTAYLADPDGNVIRQLHLK